MVESTPPLLSEAKKQAYKASIERICSHIGRQKPDSADIITIEDGSQRNVRAESGEGLERSREVKVTMPEEFSWVLGGIVAAGRVKHEKPLGGVPRLGDAPHVTMSAYNHSAYVTFASERDLVLCLNAVSAAPDLPLPEKAKQL
jgi:hypothetical protein